MADSCYFRLVRLAGGRSFKLDRDADTRQFEAALAAVNGFTLAADRAISSSTCSRRVIFKEALVAMIGITPAILEFYRSATDSAAMEEKEREALVNALHEQRIASWDAIIGVVAYDLERKEFIPFSELDEALARQPNTAIYVNSQTLNPRARDHVLAWKAVPDSISPTYKQFTGDLNELARFRIGRN